jgi:Tat protein secretion system quality control protein TatD with DNase activity
VWFDSHCHPSADAFDDDRASVLERAFASGVAGLLAIGAGWGVAHNPRTLALAEGDPRVFAAVGVHPHDAASRPGGTLLERSLHPRVVAVGECGLDYHYLRSPREAQRDVLARQLALARERRLPVSLHVRGDEPDAFGELLDLGREVGGGALEACSTTRGRSTSRSALAAGLSSFSGSSLNATGPARDRPLPLDRLVRRTPLLAPEDSAGGETSPRVARWAALALAAASRRSPTTSRNAREHSGSRRPRERGGRGSRSRALARARSIQRERYETVAVRPTQRSTSSPVDHACEKLVVEGIAAARPGDAILAEEGGGGDREGAPWRWVIDPLDGTTNYAHGYPCFCVSIGVEREDVRSVAAVYDPLLDELYTAVRGRGAWLGSRRLRVSQTAALGELGLRPRACPRIKPG